jgi:hypothetical protein
MATVTCHTDGCGNAGIGLEVDLFWTDSDGTVYPIDTVQCGVCGEPITDITEESTADE